MSESRTTPDAPTANALSQDASPQPRTQPLQAESVRQHREFLTKISMGDEPLISAETARLACEAWCQVSEATGASLPVPAACAGPDGQLLYSWDRDEHHLELEISPSGPAEFFYRDRRIHEFWGAEYQIGDPPPGYAIEKLKLFSAHPL